jgi:hypothetical protein
MVDDGRMNEAFDALQIMVAVMLLLSALPNLAGSPRMRAAFSVLGVPQALRVTFAALELMSAVGLLAGLREPFIGMNSALLMAPGLAGMAITNAARSRRRDAWIPPAMLLYLCGLIAYVRWQALP